MFHLYYLRHAAIGLISLMVGLFVSKYLNGLWFTLWLKGREFDGLKHAYFNHIYMAAGLMVGLITGIGLKLKMDVIMIRFFTGPLILMWILYLFFGVKAGMRCGVAYVFAFALSILLTYVSSKKNEDDLFSI
ncbi:hypothetical protein GC098_02345 [Paenibacillus sp. LMG 31458]|uniref:Uncharacterized protein n=2 Tax=Paenibacillus phytorum TaxID=2654977 RepID=A0ABX1XP23_9BACL|nr:hypothetical protein [Paenibacillus phytorum]